MSVDQHPLNLGPHTMALSTRGTAAATPGDGTLMWKILDDLWCPQNNPDGFVSLVVAENSLMHEELAKHIRTQPDLSHNAFTYGDGSTDPKD